VGGEVGGGWRRGGGGEGRGGGGVGGGRGWGGGGGYVSYEDGSEDLSIS